MKNGLKTNKTKVVMTSLFTAFLLLSACAQQKFDDASAGAADNVQLVVPGVEPLNSNFFKVSDSQTDYAQASLDENRTTTSFQVKLADGTLKSGLSSTDVVVTENGVNVQPFTLTSNSQTMTQTVDIVFAVDITGSMATTIESAKARLTNFILNTRSAGYHTRMCLITFGDYTVQNCNKFYDNDPKDPSTLAQVTELISEVTKLKAYKGAQDPGGLDLNENPMRALIDASKAPFSEGSQRFLILMTDDGFLYSPGNQGAVGAVAPQWSEVQDALKNSQMKVFAVTPSLAGYDKSFQGQSGIVTASQGEFFKYSDLIAGKINLDTILNKIMSRVKTTYVVEYIADNVPGLDPSLPLASREIKVSLRSGVEGTVISQDRNSNLASGREQYLKTWKLSDKAIKSGSVRVTVNGVLVTSGYTVVNGSVQFAVPPVKGSKIKITYQYASVKDSCQIFPMVISAKEDLASIEIRLNDLKAGKSDIVFEKTIEGNWSIRPSDSVLSDSDPFKIIQNGGLHIKINRVK